MPYIILVGILSNYYRSIQILHNNCIFFICFRYLSTGLAFRSLAYSFRLGISTVSQIIYSTCEAIWKKKI